ncbi:MAG: chemotaxis protein CheA [Candidatus Hodarchaeales archaeon]|jgi:two-component system chemotaxis sensor kinase CheA
MEDSKEFTELFYIELKERCDEADKALTNLEKDRGNMIHGETLLRILHTIKGMAASMQLISIAEVTHKLESVLVNESKQGFITELLTDLLFRYFQQLNSFSSSYEAGKMISDLDLTDLLNNLIHLEDLPINLGQKYKIVVKFALDSSLKGARALVAMNRLEKIAQIISSKPTKDEIQDGQMLGDLEVEILTNEDQVEIRKQLEITDVRDVEITTITDGIYATQVDSHRGERTSKEFRTIRVNLANLDQVLNGLGELVISKGRLEQYAHHIRDREFVNLISDIEKTVIELQETVMRMRMVPLEYLLNRLPRLVNEVSKEEGKKVKLIMMGRNLELDRAILDAISQPLIHLVKNAAGHGIESPSERLKLGKPEEGLIKIEAYQERDEIAIEVSDDGRGINVDKVQETAVSRGIITEDTNLSRRMLYSLIFSSGFSTKEELSTVSGRGIGLNIVKESVDAINGSYELKTRKNFGTTVTLRLPVSVTITQALLIAVEGQKFAIPMSNIERIARADPEKIVRTEKRHYIVVDKEVVPVINLERELHRAGVSNLANVANNPRNNIDTNIKREDVIIVWKKAGQRTALLVKELIGQQEIVTKKLDEVLSTQLKGFSGATILGEGDVVLILDPSEMMEAVS